jgi:hypothetical protein
MLPTKQAFSPLKRTCYNNNIKMVEEDNIYLSPSLKSGRCSASDYA